VHLKKPFEVKPTGRKQSFTERHFLNFENSPHSGSAKLDFDVYRKGTKAKGYTWSLSGGLEIRDCQDRIDLHFDGNTKTKIEQLENSRAKLAKLRSIAQAGIEVVDGMIALQLEQDSKR